MPTSVAGNKRGGSRHSSCAACHSHGFTLLELLLVVGIVAIVSASVTLALPQAGQRQLTQTGDRLAAWLEVARAHSRASGLPIALQLEASHTPEAPALRWLGLPAQHSLPTHWPHPGIQAQATRLLLGPEPVLPPQRVVLRGADGQSLIVASDGVAPFAVQAP